MKMHNVIRLRNVYLLIQEVEEVIRKDIFLFGQCVALEVCGVVKYTFITLYTKY